MNITYQVKYMYVHPELFSTYLIAW